MFNNIKLALTGMIFTLTCTITLTTSVSFADTIANLPQWQYQDLPKTTSFRGSAVIEDSLWVTGSNNSVFVSQNGGKTWQDKSLTIELTTDFRDIELFDANTAIVMGIGSGKDSVLYKTINGGNSWSLLYENQDEQGFFDAIAFWDKDNGLLLGDPVDGYYVIKRTIDGGKTWRRIQAQNIPKILTNESAFAASGNSIIVGEHGDAWFATGGDSASIYTSEDFGETWQRQSVPLYNETSTAGGYSLAINHLQQVFIIGGDYKQRAGNYANMATFHNDQWAIVDTGQHGLRTAMRCEGLVCITTGKNSNDISFDGGLSWRILANTSAEKNNHGFYTLASNQGLFLGAGAKGNVAIYSFRQ
ncbi:WD40/YVTN/BNR-like repeat-containing protein [Colwellia psychrerythraea]|uniref:DUF6242 domain-containing protein n=1 Tax=Colwellia psychrerythraea TaxID=28229 RepID=A0A099L3X4_COLPS|nr:oxidoreductase [Colwellia psychrerythraea]KGJ96867.1 hypothetical protein GAB14E_1335 [Colwellia psychrerythraea]